MFLRDPQHHSCALPKLALPPIAPIMLKAFSTRSGPQVGLQSVGQLPRQITALI